MTDTASAAHRVTEAAAVLLSDDVDGPVLLPGDGGYEDECATYRAPAKSMIA
jgi:hypothetical protein